MANNRPSQIILCLLILFSAAPLSNGAVARMIFWNVGQGSWATWSTASSCVHFDMGGEFFSARLLARECAGKRNFAVFSHWDWDHIGLAVKSGIVLADLCLLSEPGGQPTPAKARYLHRLPACERRLPLEELQFSTKSNRSNGQSRVFVQHGVLLPGDSGGSEEKKWAVSHFLNRVSVLALGHHGSRTSTSEFLLDHLRGLKFAVASARERVYGHPHPFVRARLREHGVSLLRTEIWGNVTINAP